MPGLIPIPLKQDVTLHGVTPSKIFGQVEGSQTFQGGDPVSLNSAGRWVDVASNPLTLYGVASKRATGLTAGSAMSVWQLGDGSLWIWEAASFARDGIGTLVTPQQSDVGDQAGLIKVASNWIVDTGASSKVAEVIGAKPGGALIRFLRVTTSQLVAAGAITFSSGLVSFTEITPGDVITTGAFGGMRERIHQIGDLGVGSFTPDTAGFNKFRFRMTGATATPPTIVNPTTVPAADESMTLTFHIRSDGTARAVTVGTAFQLVGGTTSFNTSAVADEELILSCSWNGTDWRCVLSGATA